MSDKDLMAQFQQASQNLTYEEQKSVEEIKLELLKLRNIPTKLEAITEKFGESGTHTFTRDSIEDALNDRD